MLTLVVLQLHLRIVRLAGPPLSEKTVEETRRTLIHMIGDLRICRHTFLRHQSWSSRHRQGGAIPPKRMLIRTANRKKCLLRHSHERQRPHHLHQVNGENRHLKHRRLAVQRSPLKQTRVIQVLPPRLGIAQHNMLTPIQLASLLPRATLGTHILMAIAPSSANQAQMLAELAARRPFE